MNDKLIKVQDKMYMKAQVIKLPTDNTKDGMLFKGNDGKITREFRRIPSSMQHLYIVTSEPIKKEDNFLYKNVKGSYTVDKAETGDTLFFKKLRKERFFSITAEVDTLSY